MNKRIEKLIAGLSPNIDGALITSDINRRYFTGFKSSAGTLLCFRNAAYLIVDFRYIEAAHAKASGCEIIEQKDLYAQLNRLIKKHGARFISVESKCMSVSEMNACKKALDCVLDIGDELSNQIISMRSVKDGNELAALSRAQGIAEAALEDALDRIRVGITEKELAMCIDFNMLKLGAECVSFDTICLFGANTSMPHGVPTDNPLKKGDVILIDFGAVCEGYHSDMTRTFFFGAVSGQTKEVYDIVLSAQQSAIIGARAGITGKQLDSAARSVIEEAGYGECFGHSVGHGIGLEIHENPNASPHSDIALCENNVITVEPGIYIPGRFGIRIEDFLVITAAGSNNFAAFRKKMTVL